MREKHRRVRCELTAIFNGRFERELMSAERRPNGRKNLLASEPHYHPRNKSGNNAQNDSYHRFSFYFLSRDQPRLKKTVTSYRTPQRGFRLNQVVALAGGINKVPASVTSPLKRLDASYQFRSPG
jgi:hypothetical protein